MAFITYKTTGNCIRLLSGESCLFIGDYTRGEDIFAHVYTWMDNKGVWHMDTERIRHIPVHAISFVDIDVNVEMGYWEEDVTEE